MSGGKNGGSLQREDDYIIKVMILLSMLIICLGILGIISLFNLIRNYQEERNEKFEESSQFDQIDYLIHLIDEQEKILNMEMTGHTNKDIETKLERYLDLHKEFSDQLDSLHEMMVGMSKNEFDVKVKGKKNEYVRLD